MLDCCVYSADLSGTVVAHYCPISSGVVVAVVVVAMDNEA